MISDMKQRSSLRRAILRLVQLPNQEGIDLLRYIRNNYPHMVTIMLTSMADQEYNDICLKLGAHFYLDKTMGLENLQPFIGKIQKLVQ